MFRWIALLLPAVIPSWRFFQTIEPSPRIEYRCEGQEAWTLACPVPQHVGPAQMLIRLVWNPGRNDALFMTSLAERVILDDRDHAKREILQRLRRELGLPVEAPLQFRMVTITRADGGLVTEEGYTGTIDPAIVE